MIGLTLIIRERRGEMVLFTDGSAMGVDGITHCIQTGAATITIGAVRSSDRYQTKPQPVRAFFYDGIDPYPVIRWFAEEFDICWNVVRDMRMVCDDHSTYWPLGEPCWFVVDEHSADKHGTISSYSDEAFKEKFDRAGDDQ